MKVLVVDDHALIREALRGVLRELHADMQVLEAETSQQGMELIQQHPDLALILLDLRLPDRDGMDVLVELRELYPAISVVMLSAFNDRDNVFKALDCGALGFIPKTDSATFSCPHCGSFWQAVSTFLLPFSPESSRLPRRRADLWLRGGDRPLRSSD